MRLYGMDPELIEIYNIRNIESIKVWDLVMNSSTKTLVIPAILVIYDGGKHKNLCAKDKYFDVFVKKVVEVYRDEKNNILEDSLTDPFRLHSRIECDHHSASILDKDSVYDINEMYKFYRDKDAYRESLLFQSNEVKRLVPMLKYHLEQLFSLTDRNVVVNDTISGYRDRYVLEGKVNGIDSVFPVSFQKISNDTYQFQVGGVYKDSTATEVNIKFNKDGIEVTCIIADEIVAKSEYKIVNGAIKCINDITRNGITIKYDNSDLPLADPNCLSNLKNLDCNDELVWYSLPWGALYGAKVNIEDLSDSEKMIEIANKFIDSDESGFISRDYYSMTYKRNKTAKVDADSMVLDEYGKNIVGVKLSDDDNIFVIETSFDDITSDYYANSRCFYHATIADGIGSISRDKLVPLGKKDEIYSGNDLSNKYKLKVLVKGE